MGNFKDAVCNGIFGVAKNYDNIDNTTTIDFFVTIQTGKNEYLFVYENGDFDTCGDNGEDFDLNGSAYNYFGVQIGQVVGLIETKSFMLAKKIYKEHFDEKKIIWEESKGEM